MARGSPKSNLTRNCRRLGLRSWALRTKDARESFQRYTDYEFGIGLRVPHYRHILERNPSSIGLKSSPRTSWLMEAVLEVLDSILEQYRVVQHGVAIYFGSADKLNREHLKKLKRLVQRTNTPWLSDHLCWGSVDGRYTHDLLPMPYTFAAAKVTAQKIREARFSRGPHLRREREQLCGVSCLGDDRVGVLK